MNTFWDNVLRVVAVIGLLAVLLLGAWGIIQLAFALPSFFGNLGGNINSLFHKTPAAETLSVSLPMSVTSAQPFTVNWKHGNKDGEYSYALSYSCAAGVSIAAPTPAGTYSTVACDTAFNYINASTSMPLVATLSKGSKATATTITVNATKLSTGDVTVTAKGNTTVNPATATTPTTTTKPTTSTSKPTTSYVPSGRTTNLYGAPDLAVRVTSAYATQYGRVTVQFVIENIGTNVSATNWSFVSTLPINGGYQYPSAPQQALYPGDKILYTLVFDDLGQNTYSACNGYTFPCQPTPTVYGGPGTCNSYGPCNVGGYPANQLYPSNPYNYSYSGSYGYSNRTVTIQIDPYNMLYELTKANNVVSASY